MKLSSLSWAEGREHAEREVAYKYGHVRARHRVAEGSAPLLCLEVAIDHPKRFSGALTQAVEAAKAKLPIVT